VVDVGGDDRPAPRHFVTNEFGSDEIGDLRAPALRAFAIGRDQFLRRFAPQILALCHIFHLGRDDAPAGIVHLADIGAGFGAQRALHHIGERGHAARTVWARTAFGLAVILRLDLAPVILLDIAARHDPFAPQRGQAGLDVDGSCGIGIGAGGVIDPQAGLIALKVDLAHGNPDAAAGTRTDMHLAAAADRPGGNAYFELAVDVGHVKTLLTAGEWWRECARHPLPPPMLIGSGSTGRAEHTHTSQPDCWLPGDSIAIDPWRPPVKTQCRAFGKAVPNCRPAGRSIRADCACCAICGPGTEP